MNIKKKFYEPLKYSGKPENFLFWGCIHGYHDPTTWDSPIWAQRGYNSAIECTEGLIRNWNSKANENTVGFLLGDTMFGKGGAEKFFELLNRLTFKELTLCAGNHFAGFHQAIALTDEDGDYFLSHNKKINFMPNYFEAFVNGQPLAFSHYPVLSWNGQSKGSYMLYSHVHNNLCKSEVGKVYLNSGAKAYECSVECNPYPISFKELKEIMDKRENISFDHHSAATNNPF